MTKVNNLILKIGNDTAIQIADKLIQTGATCSFLEEIAEHLLIFCQHDGQRYVPLEIGVSEDAES